MQDKTNLPAHTELNKADVMHPVLCVRKDAFALSQSQMNIWRLEQAYPGVPINCITTTFHMQGRLDFSALQQAIGAVIESDCSLRTRIFLDKTGQPCQYHAPAQPERFAVFDFMQTDADGVHHWEQAVAREPLPLLNAPLYRFFLFQTGEQSGGVLVKTHHIISDGWSQVLLCNRIAQAYLDLLAGRQPALEPAPSYAQHVQGEQEYLQSPMFARDCAYWENTLCDLPAPARLKRVSGAAVAPVGKRKSFALPALLGHAMQAFCSEHRVAPFAVFYLALAMYLRRTGEAGRMCVGVPVLGRVNFTEKQTTGMFVSTLPLPGGLDDSWSFLECNERFAEQWYDLLRHQRVPFGEILSLARKTRPGLETLFNVALSYQPSHTLQSDDASVVFSGRWHYSGYQAEHLCIHLTHFEDERQYHVDYDYLTQFFSETDIDRLHHSIINLLSEALAHPDTPLCELSMLSREEQERVLFTFNKTRRPLAAPAHVFGAFARQAAEHPTRAAVICRGERVRYHALEARARQLAAAIVRAAPGGGQTVAVLLPRCADLLAAMLGAALSGNAWLLLSPDLPDDRLRVLVQEGDVALVLAPAAWSARAAGLGARVLETDAPLPEDIETEFPPVSGDDMAYLIYTSGTTGTPKGVEISHASLVNFARGMQPLYGKGGVLSICGVGFDAFLIESVAALLCGKTIVLATEDEQENPAALAQLIGGFGVGFLSATPSRLSACLRAPDFARALARIESILCGGERFPGELLRALRLHTAARIYNQYGPSEATVGVCYARLGDAPRITVGRPMDNCQLYVLDEHMHPLPVGVYGELYIGGLCVGRGYHNRPELTAERFLQNPYNLGDRLYRTGDLACWTQEGELLLGGRTDDQLKLRGVRVEPQEIAAQLAAFPGVEQVAVRAFARSGGTALAAYYTSAAPIDAAALRAFAAGRLPAALLPAWFERLPALPLTANGKVDYARLPEPAWNEVGRAPQTDAERAVLAAFCSVLGRTDLNAQSDYFLHGGDSLNAMHTLALLEESLGVRLKVADLYACRTAESLARCAAPGAAPAAHDDIPAAPAQETYPLSPAQQNVYVSAHLDQTGVAYNMPGRLVFRAPLDAARLQAAFERLIAEQDVLRTQFEMTSEGVRQRVLPQVEFCMPVHAGTPTEEEIAAFVQPFDLDRAPLLRAALWQTEQGGTLLLDMHHLISDGVSTPLLLDRLNAHYSGQAALSTAPRYVDYVCWQAARAEGALAAQRAWWQDNLDGLQPLELPTDSADPCLTGRTIHFSISPQTACACDDYCARTGASAYMLFVSVYALLLARISGSRDFAVGSPVSGRVHPSLWMCAGLFMSPLPLRVRPEDELTFSGFVSQVRASVAALLDNQEVPLEALLGSRRSSSQTPLYQALFSFRPVDPAEFSLGGQPVEMLPIDTHSCKLALSLDAGRAGDTYSFDLCYADALFDDATAALYARCYQTLLSAVLADDARPLCDYEALAPADRLALIDRPNRLRAPYDAAPIDMRIDEQALLTPDAPAIVCGGAITTFAALAVRSNEIAALLQEAGARPGDRVALACARSVDLLAALVGILKVGCAYVPVLTDYPQDRLATMLELAEARLMLVDGAARAAMPGGLPCKMIDLAATPAGHFSPPDGRSADDLMYILFTSGSTGTPKGVMLPHKALCNLLAAVTPLLDATEGAVLCSTQVIFDIFITESLLPLALGRCVVLATDDELPLPWRLAALMRAHDARFVQFTPSRMQMCLSNDDFFAAMAQAEAVILVGEAVSQQLLARIQSTGGVRILNMYGPTEAAVYVTVADLTHAQRVDIGVPLANCRLYVLDEHGRHALPTARGALYLAGECLADGYVSRPDLTDAVFVPDPFFPGQRMYQSGDAARLRADGRFDFLGRMDAQVKIDGQRVEPEEVSGVLIAAGLAADAATVAVKQESGVVCLRTFVVPHPDKPFDEAAARARLAAALPAHMMPASIHTLAELPRTPSGKTDAKALRALPEQAPQPARIQPAVWRRVRVRPPAKLSAAARRANQASPAQNGAQRAKLLEIWRAVLGRAEISPDSSFFEQGGSSLLALSVLAQYDNLGWRLTPAQFYANPTPSGQLALIGSAQPSAPDEAPPRCMRSVPTQQPAQRTEGATLVTGASGYLGAHLVRALLDAGETNLVLLVRNGDRARQTLEWYFGSGWMQVHARALAFVQGDITQPDLGLPEALASALRADVARIVHAAADVRHFGDEAASLTVNRQGTENVVRFALAARASLVHISTISVMGEYLPGGGSAVFTEQDFDIGQNWRDSVYVRGKFLAEQSIYEAMLAKGLCARVMRVGRLVGRASDGIFQINPQDNALLSYVRTFAGLRAVPRSMAGLEVDLTPVDACAQAIVTLMDAPGTAFHLYHPQTFTVERLSAALGDQLPVVEDGAFDAMLRAHDAQKDPALLLFRQIWSKLRGQPQAVHPSAGQTVAALAARGFAWPELRPRLLLRAFMPEQPHAGEHS